MNAPRLILKQPTGWFAAGREVAQAMTLLSDGAFKLYLHLCLQADRHTAQVILNTVEWTQGLGKDPAWIEACLDELYRDKVCERYGVVVEICDRFWPYQKQVSVAVAAPEAEFVRQVRTAFLKPACVCSTFTAADHKLALNLYRREVSLAQVRWAIWLGCARKFMAMLNGQTRQPITSLAYFVSLIEEVGQPQTPASYWDHVRRRMEEMEKRWVQNRKLATCRQTHRTVAARNALICFATVRPILGWPTSIETAPHLRRNPAPFPSKRCPTSIGMRRKKRDDGNEMMLPAPGHSQES